MQDAMLDMLDRRKDRMIAIVMTAVENDVPFDVLRKTVLDQINDYYDLVVNVVNAVGDSGAVVNEMYYEKLCAIEDRLEGRR